MISSGVEFRQEDHRGAGEQHDVGRHEQAVGVEDRQRMQQHSSAVNRQFRRASARSTELPWVSIAPLERPVVPDV